MKNLKVYKSSAGSGKTFTLVLEYLAMVLNDPYNYRRILAVTFTNKAAHELKDRILEALHALAGNKGDHTNDQVIFSLLINKTGLDEGEIETRARWVFHHILHHYSDFSVSTIDTFVQKLARTFTRELNLPAQYEVSMETELLINLVRDRIIAAVGRDKFVTQLILDFIRRQLQEDENWRIEKPLAKFIGQLLAEDAFLSGRANELKDIEAVEAASGFMRQYRNQVLKQVITLLDQMLDLLALHDVDPEELAKGSNGFPVVIKRLKEGDLQYASTAGFFKNPPVAGKWAKGQLPKVKKEAIESIENQLSVIFQELKDYIEQHLSKTTLFKMLEENILSIALQQKITEEMDLLNIEQQEVHISEFNKRLSKTLFDASVPYIYERLGERYKHFMLDEFQDTSVLQWQNFLPLISNALAGGSVSLLVGDAKQAIYRFRSGEVEQFIRLPKVDLPVASNIDAEMASVLEQQYEAFALDTNYRSLPEVVKFNNAFFNTASKKLSADYQSVYDQAAQQFMPKNAGGFVQIDLLNPEENKDSKEAQQSRVLELVTELLASGYAPGDIVILIRSNDKGADMARYLTFEGYKVVSPDSLLVKNSDKVQLVIHALYLLTDSKDSVIASGFRYYYALTVNKINGSQLKPASYFSADNFSYNQMEQMLGLSAGTLDPAQLSKFSIYDYCEHLIRAFGFDKHADPYLMFFLEAVFSWQNKINGSLVDFLQYWEESKDKLAVTLPEDNESLRVMTIHKAKGLEFPVVIYPYAYTDFGLKSTKDSLWIDLSEYQIPGLKQAMIKLSKSLVGTDFEEYYNSERSKSLMDDLNLMYVACTRAVEQLYMIADFKKDINKTIQYQFLNELELWNDQQMQYTFGTRAGLPLNPNPTKLNQNPDPLNIVSRDWSGSLQIARQASYGKATQAVAYGIKMHELLSQLQYADQLSDLLQNRINQGFLDQSEAETLRLLFGYLAADKSLAKAFHPPAKIRNEAEILTDTGELLRPDRIAVLPEVIIVIDYKTGEQSPAHLNQILAYKNALQKLFIQQVEGHLVYLSDKPEIISV